MAKKFFYCQIKKNDFIITQGESAQAFFILASGSIEVLVNNIAKRQLKQGDGFGEIALLYGAPRSASCKALEDCFLWGIDRQTFKQVVEELTQKESGQNLKVLETVSFFQGLNSLQRQSIAGVLIEQKFEQNHPIVNENDHASSFYIIKKGIVSVMKDGNEVKELKEGQSFGESALMSNSSVRTMSIVAKTETICLALGRDTLTQLLGKDVELIINRNITRWGIEKTVFGKDLEPLQFENILEIINFSPVKDGQVVLSKGTTLSHQFIIVIAGVLQYKKDGKILTEKFGNIGEQDVFNLTSNKLPDDIIANQNCVIAQISLKDLTKAVGGAIKDIVQQNKKKKELKDSQENSITQALKVLKINDFYALKHLGEGQFGNVFLVKTQNSSNLYALKCIKKDQEEKKVMEYCNFGFIMRYFRCFQDQYYIFFLIEFIAGMELFDVIREIGLLSKFDAQFYFACTFSALEYLHKCHIIYRDIKPENIMVDEFGYAKLVDMGTAHQFSKGHKTNTIIGTPHYMAPEIIAGKGYSYFVDLWSLGIMFFEFLGGGVPFGEDLEDPMEIYQCIVKSKHLNFPDFFSDKEGRQLAEQLLSKQPELRLGGSYGKIKRHPFFHDFDWLKLNDMNLKTPWIPPKEKRFDQNTIHNLQKHAKPVLEELQEHYTGKAPKSNQNPDWDKIFDF